jgi:peptidyl-tRNA hydrolase, PTH1 family
MKLILAQGNPEARYDHTRHNIGFDLIDIFAKENGAEWTDKPKFHASVAEFIKDGEKILLVKPSTYYNETGIAAHALKDFYKADDILVIHDDLALPFGTIRVRSKGSDAGNNGIKSLNAHLGEDFRRIRVGIWNEQRNQIDDVNFVLGKLTAEERAHFTTLCDAINALLNAYIKGSLEDHSFNLRLPETS